jgi:hypothetical protein
MPDIENQDCSVSPGMVPCFVNETVVEEKTLSLMPTARLSTNAYSAIPWNIQRKMPNQFVVCQAMMRWNISSR